MEKDPVVVPTGQGTPNTPHHGGAGTHLNSEGGPLQAAHPGGRGNPDTSVTGRDRGRTPSRGGNISGSAGTMHGAGGRKFWDEGGTYKGLDKGGKKVKGHRTNMVG